MAIFERECSVVAWAVKPVFFGLPFDRTREMCAPSRERLQLSVFTMNEKANVLLTRVGECETGARHDLAGIANFHGLESEFLARYEGISSHPNRTQGESARSEREELEKLTSTDIVVFFPIDREIGLYF